MPAFQSNTRDGRIRYAPDIAQPYAQKLAKDGNDITYVHYPELSHAFIQMTAHSKRYLEDSTQEVARLLGKGLAKS